MYIYINSVRLFFLAEGVTIKVLLVLKLHDIIKYDVYLL